MDKIVVIGGGGHARVIVSILRKLKKFEIIGYVDVKDRGVLLETSYLGTDKALEGLKKSGDVKYAVMAIGILGPDMYRKKLCNDILNLGFSFPAIISPDSCIGEDVIIGDGTVIMDGAVVNVGTRIGKFGIINTNATVDHDAVIEDNVHVAPGSILSGGVEVGDGSFIGAGATVIQYKKISENIVIGAGAVVTEDCVIAGTYVGKPAKILMI